VYLVSFDFIDLQNVGVISAAPCISSNYLKIFLTRKHENIFGTFLIADHEFAYILSFF